MKNERKVGKEVCVFVSCLWIVGLDSHALLGFDIAIARHFLVDPLIDLESWVDHFV